LSNTDKWIFSPLNDSLSREEFDCGNERLNEYLKKYAYQNHKKNISKTYVATEVNKNKIVGYYTINNAQFNFIYLPPSYKKNLPRYPVPAMRICRLAVDRSVQRRGLGGQLLVEALLEALSLSKTIGIYAVIVDAKNEESIKFYKHYGFISFLDDPCHLFIPIKTIESSFT